MTPPEMMTGLVIPADRNKPCVVVRVSVSSVAISDVIGGGFVDDVHIGALSGERYGLYLDEERLDKNLPFNDRAAVLTARIGWAPRHDVALRGDLLIVGITPDEHDTDIPEAVLDAAWRAGMISESDRHTSPVPQGPPESA